LSSPLRCPELETAVWPVAPVPPWFYETNRADVPTLILAGSRSIPSRHRESKPPSWARHFPR
jgi:hypothetical protein